MLSPLDEALVRVQNSTDNIEKLESQYYELFLNTKIFIPTWDVPEEEFEGELQEGLEIQPVIIEDEGKTFLMLFDSKDRLSEWTKNEELGLVAMTGYEVLKTFGSDNHMLLNVTSDHIKEFIPEEIEWLKTNTSKA